MTSQRFVAGLLACIIAVPVARAGLPEAEPETVGMDAARLRRIDAVVAEGISAKEMSGCVVCIGRRGKIVFSKAYGHRFVEPDEVPLTVDTLYDLASITKPVATATSVMILLERGRLRLRDRVSKFVPEFAQNGKKNITVLDLLIHQGGLIPDNALQDYDDGPERALERIYALDCHVEPGTKFVYTDVGFIMLADIVKRITGKNVHEFTRENLFGPLGMDDTGYVPREALRNRAAPTEKRDGHWMLGEVHDPRSYRLGGIAGHAGLFSTAHDLAIYAQMMLDGGQYQGMRVLSPQTVRVMTASYKVSSGVRGLGWDRGTGYSSNRGDLFSESAFGHGGFTGTAMWIDPELDLFVIFLSSRLYPDGTGYINPLAGRIGAIAAGAIRDETAAVERNEGRQRVPGEQWVSGQGRSVIDVAGHPTGQSVAGEKAGSGARGAVLTGIDILQRERFRRLRGQRVGLITNHTGINRRGESTLAILHAATEVDLTTLFSPEHGIAGQLDQSDIDDTIEPTTGLKVFSLYGEERKPTAESLQNVDTLVFDIQDIGARFYTYVSTMGLAMQAAAEHDLKFVVLDRPNPINGVDVSGPVLDTGSESFVAFHSIPVRHGMTVGELAVMFRQELELGVNLEVVCMEGWRRDRFFDETGLLWVNPSPNMRCLTQAILYPGIGLLETTNLSVGRGTDTPFEVIGAPWLDGQELAAALSHLDLAGVRFVPIRFTPEGSKFAEEPCGGVNLIITDRAAFSPLLTGLEIARQLRKLYPDDWQVAGYGRLLGSQQTLRAVEAGKTVAEMRSLFGSDLSAFARRREGFLLYPTP